MKDFKYSPNMDTNVPNIKDIVPSDIIKVYPYEFIQTRINETFILQNSVTLATISQTQLTDTHQKLQTDENGNKYFEMYSAVTSDGKLDISTVTSVYGQELKEEDEFVGTSNWYYETELDKIQMGNLNFMPALFVIGEPFNEDKYRNGEQATFIPLTMIEAKKGNAQYHNNINPEGLYEFNLANITAIETSFQNVRIIPTFTSYSHPNFSGIDSLPKITIGTNHSTLFNHVKLRASYLEKPKTENNIGIIDLYSMNNIAPIMFSTTSVSENIEMYCDWFNYDNAMPWVYAQNFRNGSTGAKAKTLESYITESVDVKLINAMLYTTAAFADSFSKAPRIGGTAANSDKIQPTFKIFDLLGVAIEGKDPVKVVDGLYEQHIRDYPSFLANKERVQKVNMTIAALSRYIYSSHSIGKGQNSFNSLYLPWFLEPSSKIDYTIPSSSGLSFNLKTNYFKTNFTNKQDFDYGGNFEAPSRVNLTSQILLRSDRPTTLPQLSDVIQELNKLPLAGDIDTSSNEDLKNLYFVQIQNITEMQKLFVNDSDAISVAKKNQTKVYPSFTLPKPRDTLTVAEAIAEILSKPENSGWSSADGQVSLTKSAKTVPIVITSTLISQSINSSASSQQMKSIYDQVYRNPDGSTQTKQTDREGVIGVTTISKTTGTKTTYIWTIGDANLVKITSETYTSYSVKERQLIYNKQEWQSFLTAHSFNLNPNGLEMNFADNVEVKVFKELTIGSIWAEYIDLTLGENPTIRIPMFNKDDETIGIQRIIFT